MDQETDEIVEDQTQDDAPVEEQNPYSLYNDFINDIPEGQRPLVDPFAKKWDELTSQRIQEIEQQYEPFKQFGDMDQEAVHQAITLRNLLENDPEYVYNILAEDFGQQQQEQQQQQDPVYDEEGRDQWGNLPPEFLDRYNRTEQMTEQIASILVSQRQQLQEQQEDQELDSYLEQLRQQHGDFDEDYVLLQLERGVDGSKAVESWNNAVQSRVNQVVPQRQLPPTLSGGGSVPYEQVDPGKLSRKDVKDFVANVLSQSAPQG